MTPLLLVVRNLARRPGRTALTGAAVAVSVFVVASLVSLDRGVARMVEETAGESVVVVFERYKACPPYSRLPLAYRDRIAAIPHVAEVMPVRFLLSSCQTATDLVAIHGVEPALLPRFRDLDVPEEDFRTFAEERDAALVGSSIARRYGWRPGDHVTLAELRGVRFTVRGVFRAAGSSLDSVILLHREHVERSVDQVGVVTLFQVLVDPPDRVDEVSRQIDEAFAAHPARTRSGPEKEFIAASIQDFSGMVRFARVVAAGALVLLLAAVANSVSLSVRDRLAEMAVLRTLGFRRARVTRLLLGEAALLALAASTAGCAAAWALAALGGLSIGVEGYTITPHLSAAACLAVLAAGGALGAAGAWLPARLGGRLPIVRALREVD